MRQRLSGIAMRYAFWYGVLVAAWVSLTDIAVAAVFGPGADLALARALSGWVLAAVATVFLYRLLRRILVRWERRARRHDRRLTAPRDGDLPRDELLRESEQRNRTLLDALADGVFVAQDQRFVFCNPALPALLGYGSGEFVGLHFNQVVAPEFLDLWTERFNKRVAGGPEPHKHYEVRMLCKGGERAIWMELRANRIEFQRRPAVLGILRDITVRKRTETAVLHAQKLETLGTLAGGIAHDFNHVLMAIAGNTQLAKAELDAAHPAQVSLNAISKAAHRASDLVQRILLFGRAQEHHRENIDLRPVVEEALALVRATLPARIELVTTFAQGVPQLLGDATQVLQVAVNLAANAAHAIGDGNGRIEFQLAPVEAGEELASITPGLKTGTYARLTVADNGCGMDRATLERIFDPFFTTRSNGAGAGLGLANVHAIMKSHDGAVTVYSQPGKGTTFQLYFPAAAGTTPLATNPPVRKQAGHAKHVLYVDDDHDLVFLMQRMLDRLGHRITAFTDAREAMAAFEAAPLAFDAVVTDLSMPTLSGFDVVQRVTAVRPEMPVVVTSGYVRPEDHERARVAGARAVILKPNTIDGLADLLETLLNGNSDR